MLQLLLEQSKEQKSDSDAKFNVLTNQNNELDMKFKVQNNKFNDLNNRFDEINIQNAKFEDNINKRLNEMDECFNTIKQQNFSFSERINEIDTHCTNIKEPVSYTHLDVYKRQKQS